jgi:four helix bundle protein
VVAIGSRNHGNTGGTPFFANSAADSSFPGGAVKDFRQLKVWEKAHQLPLEIYRITVNFPRVETYGLTSQIRRAGASIGANLAEGYGREGDAELGRFCGMARGSASELEYHRLLAKDLGLLEAAGHHRLAGQTTEIKRMLTALIQKLNAES